MTGRPRLLDTTVHLDGVPVRLTVVHWGDCTGTVYHFEYGSVSEPRRPIPVSDTGYLSHFLIADRALSPDQLRDYGADYGGQLLASRSDESEQPSLFG